jgi:hypothetical protein
MLAREDNASGLIETIHAIFTKLGSIGSAPGMGGDG